MCPDTLPTTRRASHLGRLFLAIPLALALGACGDSPTTPPPPSASGFDGEWSGTTSQGRPITFTVVSQKVVAITVGYSFGSCSGTHSFTNLSLDIGTPPNPGAPSIGPGFGFASGNPEGPNFVQIFGNFPTSTTVSGSLILANHAGCGMAFGIWSATRR